jgi:tungstate transport system ATP-binding protein
MREPATPPTQLLPLEARAITFTSRNRTLLDAVSFTITSQTPTIIMGANGAGKSLLLRILHGLIQPSGGQVLWANGTITATSPRQTALVFQRPVLLRRSALDNIAFVLTDLPRDQRTTAAAAILENAGLTYLAATPARHLSGGEQQRLALARALALNPQVLFLDEPTASLDPAATLAIGHMMASAAAIGTKLILVTHNRGQAKRLGGEIIFLDKGHVTEQTAATAFFANPTSPAARAYLDGELWV